MSQPMVSVIVATYRRDESLRKAITSILSQTYQNIEIIVVDDNATIDWNQKVEAIIREFENVIYIQNRENQGSAETRNIGIRASTGEYVTFLDDDDIYLPEKVAHQLNRMIEDSADYSVTDLDLYNENDVQIDRRVRNRITNTSKDSLLKYHLIYHITGTDTIMFRKDYLLEIGGFPRINVGDEFYLIKEAICGDGKFIYVPGCNVKAYVHTGENSLSSGQGKIDGEKVLYAYKKKYFYLIDRSTRKFIKMRHHAVLAYAEKRRKRYVSFFKEGVCSFISSPIDCIRLLIGVSKR